MDNLAVAIPVTDEQESGPVWKQAILAGPYLKRMRCQIKLDQDGRILDCNRISSIYRDTPKFDAWFRALYTPIVLKP